MATAGESAEFPIYVSTLEELQTALITPPSGLTEWYIELSNNIDGNEYEIGTPIALSTQAAVAYTIHLNLATYAIQNWYVAKANNLLYIRCNMYLSNGKIINNYGWYESDSASSTLLNCQLLDGQTVEIENVAFSVDSSKFSNGAIYTYSNYATSWTTQPLVLFRNCSFYGTGSNRIFAERFWGRFEQCDFYFKDYMVKPIYDYAPPLALNQRNGRSNAVFTGPYIAGASPTTGTGRKWYQLMFQRCRFQGSITFDQAEQRIPATSATNPQVCVSSNGVFHCVYLDNCVYNVNTQAINQAEPESGQKNPVALPTIIAAAPSVIYSWNLGSGSGVRLTLLDTTLINISAGATFIQAREDQMDMRLNPNADVVLNDELGFDVQKG